jgi:putative metallohydrolase (TIGR04338 family)
MARDSQRGKVYAAENAAFDKSKSEDLSVAECQAFIDKCLNSKGLQSKYPKATRRYKVTDGRGRRTACYAPLINQLRVPRWARSRWVLLHELAHALVFSFSDSHAPHGWEFCECYLYLVRVFLGRWAEDALKAEFKARRVRYRPPRKRQMSDEQRQAARERMLAYHAAKEAA